MGGFIWCWFIILALIAGGMEESKRARNALLDISLKVFAQFEWRDSFRVVFVRQSVNAHTQMVCVCFWSFEHWPHKKIALGPSSSLWSVGWVFCVHMCDCSLCINSVTIWHYIQMPLCHLKQCLYYLLLIFSSSPALSHTNVYICVLLSALSHQITHKLPLLASLTSVAHGFLHGFPLILPRPLSRERFSVRLRNPPHEV